MQVMLCRDIRATCKTSLFGCFCRRQGLQFRAGFTEAFEELGQWSALVANEAVTCTFKQASSKM